MQRIMHTRFERIRTPSQMRVCSRKQTRLHVQKQYKERVYTLVQARLHA